MEPALDFNLAIAWIGLGWTHLDLGEFSMALDAYGRAETRADRCRFRRAALECRVYRVEAELLAGSLSAGDTDGALAQLEAAGPFDGRALESAARVARLRGHHERAEALLARVLARERDPSFGAASALQERARLRGSRADWEAAAAQFGAVGLAGRVDRGPIREVGQLSLGGGVRV